MPCKSEKANDEGLSDDRLGKVTNGLAARSPRTFVIVGIGACFIAWASLFIYHSSIVGIDGWRYFCLFDDAMISMRYAWNFSHGLGLVWNQGEYVEGYTNFLMTLLMSLATLLFDKGDAVLVIQILGIIFMLANAYLVMSIAEYLIPRQKRYHQLFRALAFLCALSYYPLLYWSLMGMETGLLAVLLSLSILSALRYAKDRRPAQGVLLSVSLGLAFLTRPDTLVLAVPIFAYALYATRKSERGTSLTFLVKVLGLYVVFIAGQELFRWGYYGEWLPNTYALKVSGIPLLARIWNGVNFVWPFLKEIYIPLIVVGAGVVFGFRRDKLFLAGLFIVLVCYKVWAGGDSSIYWRLLSPAVPIMLVLGVYEILMVLEYVSETAGIRRWFLRNPTFPRVYVLGVFACLLVLGMLWSVNSRFLPEMAMLSKFNAVRTNEDRVNVALVIEQLTTPDATVGVFDAGAIPYYSGRPSIDFLGKMDRSIAWLPPDLSGATSNPLNEEMIYNQGHNRYDLEYSIKELRPTYARSFTWGGQNVVDWAKSEYVSVVYKGVRVNFLKGSKDVRWDDIEAARQAGEAIVTTPKW
jgi:arabinofuranosyltransferase